MRYLVRVGENRYINLLNVTEICGLMTPKGAIRLRFTGPGAGAGPSSQYADLTGEEADRFREFLEQMSVSLYTALARGDTAGIIDLIRQPAVAT